MMAEDKALSFSPFIPAAATLIAAFVGSLLGPWVAFKRENKKQEQKIKADNITAGNYAIFTIMCQFNRLANVCKQMIDPVRTHPLKIVVMRPMVPVIEYEDLKFDMS